MIQQLLSLTKRMRGVIDTDKKATKELFMLNEVVN
jgi:hypothetical protein